MEAALKNPEAGIMASDGSYFGRNLARTLQGFEVNRAVGFSIVELLIKFGNNTSIDWIKPVEYKSA